MNVVARLVPPAFLIWLYWKGLFVWFQGDDFAWLGLSGMIQSPADLLPTFFKPMAQGTVRPFSERLYFITLHWLFGLDALPFRIWAFAVMAANVALVQSVAFRLTRDRMAAFLAAIFWAVNLSLVEVMTWNSVYNQAACAFVLLLCFYLLLRFIETSDRRFWIAQWIVYLLGFGVMELNVVYPAIALAYAILISRQHVRKTLWLFLPAIIYAVLHRMAASGIAPPSYQMHVDASMLRTLWGYWQWGFHTTRAPSIMPLPELIGWIAFLTLSSALLIFALYQCSQKRWLPLFALAWFVITLAPMLPLRDHVSTYYLTIPTIGLAIVGALAFCTAWRLHPAMRVIALLLAGVYGYAGVPSVRRSINQSVTRTRNIEHLVGSVAGARQLHPGKVILITDLEADTFWLGMIDEPFRLIGIRDVYLAPEMEGRISPRPEIGRIADYVLPAPAARRALQRGQAVVYSAAGPVYKNVTVFYEAKAIGGSAEELPRRVDCGNRAFNEYLGPEWYAADAGVRWMPKQASIRLAAPKPGDRLYLAGYRGGSAGSNFPVRLTVSANTKTVGVRTIPAGETQFAFEFDLPHGMNEELAITLQVDRTFRPPNDGRDLGLAFGIVELR